MIYIYNSKKLVQGLESNPGKIRYKFIQMEYNMFNFNEVKFFRINKSFIF